MFAIPEKRAGVAMPALHHPVREKEKANTKIVASKRARALTARKSPPKKKAKSQHARATLATKSRCVSEDALDARLICEARQADRGKARFSLNELRAQRGLRAI